MKLKLFLLIIFVLFLSVGYSQNRIISFGLERQQYSTGNISGIRAEFRISDHRTISLRGGKEYYEWSGYSYERGEGYGGTIGFRYYRNTNFSKLFLGARADIFRINLDWSERDHGMQIPYNSKIVSFQPSVLAGYVVQIGSHFRITPTIALGYQWNLNKEGMYRSKGSKDFDGDVLLFGLNLGFRIK